jgi:hypothetical protein
MNFRTGRAAKADSAFTFAGNSTDQETRDAIAFAAEVYQPGLRVLLDTLGRDDVQERLMRLGALRTIGGEPQRSVDDSRGRSR